MYQVFLAYIFAVVSKDAYVTPPLNSVPDGLLFWVVYQPLIHTVGSACGPLFLWDPQNETKTKSALHNRLFSFLVFFLRELSPLQRNNALSDAPTCGYLFPASASKPKYCSRR